MRLLSLCVGGVGNVNGIRDYAVRLIEALNATPFIDAQGVWRDEEGFWSISDVPAAIDAASQRCRSVISNFRDCDFVLVQYNPFMYGRWGFAPWLPFALLRLSIGRKRPLIALVVHEPFVPSINWRWRLMGIWQRLQLWALRLSADVVFASIEAWTQRLALARPRRPVYHLPVGSNLPDGRAFRIDEGQRNGASKRLTLATFGQHDRVRLSHWIVQACNTLSESGWRVTLLNLGAGPVPLLGLNPEVVVDAPGVVPADQIAHWLSSTDIYLAPYAEGASTRRTTLVAAMQHGLPIVATDGPLTDTILRSSQALRLVDASRTQEFSQAVLELANSPDDRRALGSAARILFEDYFAWPVIAKRLLGILGEASTHSTFERQITQPYSRNYRTLLEYYPRFG